MAIARCPANDIISLVEEAPRYDLGESTEPDPWLADVLDAFDLAGAAVYADDPVALSADVLSPLVISDTSLSKPSGQRMQGSIFGT